MLTSGLCVCSQKTKHTYNYSIFITVRPLFAQPMNWTLLQICIIGKNRVCGFWHYWWFQVSVWGFRVCSCIRAYYYKDSCQNRSAGILIKVSLFLVRSSTWPYRTLADSQETTEGQKSSWSARCRASLQTQKPRPSTHLSRTESKHLHQKQWQTGYWWSLVGGVLAQSICSPVLDPQHWIKALEAKAGGTDVQRQTHFMKCP